MPFREITGHRHLFALITTAAVRGTLPPSLIFAGPEGVGKRLAAVALAQLVNCQSPVDAGYDEEGAALRGPLEAGSNVMRSSREPGSNGAMRGPLEAGSSDMRGVLALGSNDMHTALELGSRAVEKDACGICASCRRIARGVHADVLVVEPGDTGAIKVDQVRDAIERTAYRPFEGRRRVVIVDEADAVLVEAQNALLKTLEEPPPASMFVLVTARPDVLLPTVRSRCQRLRFGRLAPADIAAVLMRDHGYAEADAHAAASASDGSIGLALEGGSEAAAAARDAAARLLQGVAASTDPRRRLDGARALAGGGADRDELGRRLRALSSLLRDVGLLSSRGDERYLANADMKPVLTSLLKSFDGGRALRAYSAVDRALSALDRNASPKIVADWLAFQI
jgi:DNA polymerase-3 subunit delta'